MIQRLSRTATSILDLNNLSNTILKDVVHTLDASWGAMFLKRDSRDFQQIAWEGNQKDFPTVLKQDHPILDWLSKPQDSMATYSLNEALEQNFLSKGQLRDLNLAGNELLIPLKTRDQLIGILCLGARVKQQPYSQNNENIL
jgi:GAF domain-containing protein